MTNKNISVNIPRVTPTGVKRSSAYKIRVSSSHYADNGYVAVLALDSVRPTHLSLQEVDDLITVLTYLRDGALDDLEP